MLVKILGIIDIISAIILFFPVQSPIKLILVLVLLIKGVSSFFADLVGRIYGIVDILASVFILFSISIPIVNIILAAILIFKGIFSMF